MITPKGKISVSWVKTGNEINYTLFIPKGIKAKIKLQNAVFYDSNSNSEECTDGIFNYRLSAI
jgi:predicted peptidase